ncbi:MAG: hypothetical protein ACLU38_15845 [Dysosmobacter sp.]
MLAAVLIYFAVQLYNYLSDPCHHPTLVTEGQAEDTIPLNGWMVRDEEPLAAQSGTIDRVRQRGRARRRGPDAGPCLQPTTRPCRPCEPDRDAAAAIAAAAIRADLLSGPRCGAEAGRLHHRATS